MSHAGAITFDFHNTLVQCDAWFEMEVRSLPSAFLRQRADQGNGADHERSAAADRAYRVLRLAIIEHGHELSAERCLAVVLDRVGVPASEDEIASAVAAMMSATLPTATPVAGSVEAVAYLAKAGVPLAVVSSAVYHPFLEWALDRFGMLGHVDFVATSAATGYYKSRPEIYWAALGALGRPVGASLHVGDSYRFDVLGAQRAGMRAAWLSPGQDDGADADILLQTLEGAGPTLLRGLDSRPT